MGELEKVFVESAAELRGWLKENHARETSVWLVKWKKGFGKSYISYDKMVDELLCFGWIDSLPKKLNEEKTMCRISPRKPKSNWSRINKERIDRLIESGRIHEPGLRMVELAKSTGTWSFLDDVENLIIPEDLEIAFSANPDARTYFERFPDSSKRSILEWIKTAKQDSTREKRIRETVEKAGKNIKANHPKGRDAGPTQTPDRKETGT